MPSVPRLGAIGLICVVVVLLSIGMAILLSPSGLAGVIGVSADPTAAPFSPSEQTVGPGTPLAPEAEATATAAAILDLQPFASTPTPNSSAEGTPGTSQAEGPETTIDVASTAGPAEGDTEAPAATSSVITPQATAFSSDIRSDEEDEQPERSPTASAATSVAQPSAA